MLMLTELAGCGAGGGTVEISYRTHANSTTDLTTYTFSTQDIGAAAPDRFVIVGIGSRANSARSISSVTIGGVTATLVGTANDTGGGADIASLWIAQVPTGTTGDVVVTFSGAMLRCGIVIWRMVGALSGGPSAIQTDTTLSTATYSVAIAIPANGGAVGIGWCAGTGSQAATWVGLTENADAQPETTSNNYTGASNNFATSQSALTVSTTDGGTTPTNGGLAVAAWGP